MISLQARLVKAFCRIAVKRRMRDPSASPSEGIRKLRRSIDAWNPSYRRFTRGLRVRYVETYPPGEWLLPRRARPERAILYVHGGAFVACSPLSHRALTTALVRASGVPLFAVRYRLAPEHPFPAALDDVLAAFDALVEGGIAAGDIVLVGDSAGGGLVLSAALALRSRRPAAGLAGVVAYSPWTDLLATGASICTNARSDDMLVGSGVARSARQYVRSDADLRDPLASPLYGELAGLPPVLVFASTSEVLRDDASRFVERARRSGSPAELILEPGMPHVWPVFFDVMPEAKRTVKETAAFVRRVLRT